ncbi:MAG: Sphingolipid ceramide N-deacylase [uncultured Solirubrobacteraceae bacterium]|uniref:Sphingolipid ceramide N-deacylase n=1 Tax=uncultured Solirubrobacteraceae bacterium TaxID=1162706 RepID=A0A6J4SZR3_9ACTN|nr:MAG: Sphingolipid ceramide N-deacylase [uncultured Solirubrobacteraceae bacterium]
MSRLLCLALLALAVLAPAAQAAGEQYALVNGCWSLKVKATGGVVGKDGSGYKAGAPAEAFRMQATDLGKYLLYGRARDFLTDGGSDTVTVAAKASEAAIWRVEPADGQTFRLSSPSSGRLLAAGPDGTLRIVDANSAGDAALFSFERADGCPQYPEVEVNVSGEPMRGATAFGEVRGTIDAHMHHMAYEFIGGRVHCGKPWDQLGVEFALVDCPDHQAQVQPVDTALGGEPAHDPTGWPTFKDWPDDKSLTHETSYHRWVERAWRGGLRVFVNLLVDNEVLCEVYPLKKNPCNEMNTVRLEAQRMREFADYVDAQYGGPGKGWYRIVTSPAEARRVINDGKLAVVMGIEISKLFDCGVVNDRPQCDRAQIDKQLDEVHRLGVRDLELVNKFDNALGGVAGDTGQTGVVTNTGNKQDTGQYWQMGTCQGDPMEQDREQLTPAGDDSRDQLIANFSRFLPPGQAPIYPKPPHCNQRGLSDLGEYLIRRMMAKGMIIDPDHLSVSARDEVLAIVEAARYSGIVSSHTWSTPAAEQRILKTGGFITPYAGNSTKFVKEWERVRKGRDPRFYWGFGYGADMNGFGAQGGPRGADVPNPVVYPFRSPIDPGVTVDKQKSGEKVYDINVHGVDHYGLYPDWLEDLRKLAGQEIVEDMARGAEAYLQMWERADGVPANRCVPARTRFTKDGLGRLRLGAKADDVLRRAGQPNSRPGRGWTYCVQGPRDARRAGLVKPVFTQEGVLALVASTGPEHSAARTAARVRASKLRGTRAFGKGLRVRRAGGGRTYVYGVKRGRVQFVAVATRTAAKDRRTLRRYLRVAGF